MLQKTLSERMSEQLAPPDKPVAWKTIVKAGGIHSWVHQELSRKGLIEDGVDTSSLSDKARQQYKAHREEERRVRKLLYKQAWAAY